jgi:hypothetical protein
METNWFRIVNILGTWFSGPGVTSCTEVCQICQYKSHCVTANCTALNGFEFIQMRISEIHDTVHI